MSLRALPPEVDPEAAATLVDGSAAEGNDWGLRVEADGVVAGLPAVGEVRAWGLDGAARGVLVGPAGEGFGATLARVGGELLVGAPTAEGGAVYRYAAAAGLPEDAAPVGTLVGTGRLGSRLAGCGDIDGDGLDDWAAAAVWAEPEGVELAGEVVVVGSAAGWTSGERDAADLPRLAVPEAAAGFGRGLGCARSLDGDPLAEVLVGAPWAASPRGDARTGVVRVWRGGALDGEPALVLAGDEDGEGFGEAVAVGDLDGDGRPDLAVGAPGRTGAGADGDNQAGAVYVWFGDRLAPALVTPGAVPGALSADLRIDGVYARGRAGAAIAVADVDGDGVDELLMGAPGVNPTGAASAVQAGALYVFAGLGAAVEPLDVRGAASVVGGDRQYLRVGERFATGPLDADPGDDLLLLLRTEGAAGG